MNDCACGQSLSSSDRFCPACGKATAALTPATVVDGPFQWRWALASIPITVGVVLALSFAVGMVMGAAGIPLQKDPRGQAIGALVLLLSMFAGGVVVGYASPGRTIREPGLGIAAALVAANLLGGERGTGLFFSWVLPFVVGSAGAKVGEWLQGRASRR